ncbi:MAG: uroporphyrinogen decarboxylase [Alphaproteobacteria bacterium]|nr:uroporphyrinogen decarboxylase [Alphaproteobacteria bacterium]
MEPAARQETGREKLLIRALKGAAVERPPVWLMRQAGRYLPEYRELRARAGSFLNLCYTPELAAEVTLQPLRRFAFDGAILFADLPLLADALGQKLDYREGEGPVLEPVRDEAALAQLSMARMHDRLGPVYETVRRLRRQLPEEVTLIGFAGAPWTLATYMVQGRGSQDHAEAKRWAFRDEVGFGRLIHLLVDATTEYLSRQIEAGAEAVQIFDSWASAMPEAGFARWCIEPVGMIVRRLKSRHPHVPVIAFPRAVGIFYAGFAEATGADAVGIDSCMPLSFAQKLQKSCTVQGNLDPQLLAVGGEPMRRESARILEMLGRGRFVFNLGHGILPDTPPEHVGALVEQVRAWRP